MNTGKQRSQVRVWPSPRPVLAGHGWVRTIAAPALLVVLLGLADPSLQGPGRHLPSPAQVAVIVAGAAPLLWRLRRPLLVTVGAVTGLVELLAPLKVRLLSPA